jgi:hypothetical protein
MELKKESKNVIIRLKNRPGVLGDKTGFAAVVETGVMPLRSRKDNTERRIKYLGDSRVIRVISTPRTQER